MGVRSKSSSLRLGFLSLLLGDRLSVISTSGLDKVSLTIRVIETAALTIRDRGAMDGLYVFKLDVSERQRVVEFTECLSVDHNPTLDLSELK